MADLNQFLGGGGDFFKNEKIFTTSGTFTVPKGVLLVYVSGCGGGAGGGAGERHQYITNAFENGGYGGNSGHCFRFIPVEVTPEESITIEVGAGGIGATNPSNTNGSHSESYKRSGGLSSFESYIFLGGPGSDNPPEYNDFILDEYMKLGRINYLGTSRGGYGGKAAASSKNGVTFWGSPYSGGNGGTTATSGSNYATGGGGGGASYWGSGGNAGNGVYNAPTKSGGNATGYGAGGGGGGAAFGSGSSIGGGGGNGSSGIIIVNW